MYIQRTFKGMGQRIATARHERGLTQPELAERMGISKGAVAHWERDFRLPGLPHMVSLADILGRSIDWLCNGAERQ